MCRGGAAWMFFSDYLLSRTGGCQYPNKTGGGCFIFGTYHSGFDFFFYAPNCRNLPELAFACYVVFEKKSGPDSEGENLWTHLLFDDYNLGHGE